jgi:hypothetical protein
MKLTLHRAANARGQPGTAMSFSTAQPFVECRATVAAAPAFALLGIQMQHS